MGKAFYFKNYFSMIQVHSGIKTVFKETINKYYHDVPIKLG